MSFRSRVFLALLLGALLPLGGLAIGVRRELSQRLTAQYRSRVDALVRILQDDVTQESKTLARRLDALSDALTQDNQFRLAAIQGDAAARRYLLDYAERAMQLAGLSMLQLQDSSGRILSSGHFRNAYDERQPAALQLLGAGAPIALLRTQTAEGVLLVLARGDSVRVAGRRFALIGGIAADERWLRGLARDPELTVRLIYPGSGTSTVPADSGEVVGEVALPYLDVLQNDGSRPDTARFVVTHSLITLRALQRSTDLWFLGAFVVTALVAVLAAGWLASRVSRPLSELAAQTATIDLDRLDADFTTERTDEIGALSHLLAAMVGRLRRSAGQLREAERRIALGDVARQVNHDIKNGLAPIRHVLRHLSQVAQGDPQTLAAVFEERKGTLESSVSYLENLARNYARLTPSLAPRPCDLNAIVREAARTATGRGDVRMVLADHLPPAQGDDMALRRILDNLIGNALDSLDGRGGTVTVSTERAGTAAQPTVRIVVADTGRGMSRAELDRAFDDFFTTKATGTGLGLSIVRRLVLDLGGALRVDTEPGAGTRVSVELPV